MEVVHVVAEVQVLHGEVQVATIRGEGEVSIAFLCGWKDSAT